MIELHAWPTPNGIKISIMLEECGLPFTSVPIDIRNGDHMVIYIGEDTLIDGAIYVLNTDNGTMVKEVQLDPRGGLKLISKNPSYAPLPVSADEREQLSFAGRLVMTLKRFA